MPLRRAQPLTFRAKGLSDAVDGTDAFSGAMQVLQDLIPNPANQNQFICRPAATQVTNFTGFSMPGAVTAQLVIGSRVYGMIGSSRNPGKDEPFIYDLTTATFISISGVTADNTPATPAATGDWAPPTLDMIANRVLITHPGYDGVTHFIGWIDMRGFTSTSLTGHAHNGTAVIDTLSSSPVAAGAQVGDSIAGTDIPAGSFIISMTATSITISQNMTGSTAAVPLTITSGTPAAPQYGAGQTSGNPLVAVPVAVTQFNGRAYYAVLNGVQFSDSLIPLQITNATQALVLGNSQPVTALGGLPLANQVVGGTVQSIIAIKGDALYYQITGDPVTLDLRANAVQGSVGTLAPNTITPTPLGLAYIAPDGLRIIGLDGKSSDPIGTNGSGVALPFIYAINPTRMCAAYNQNVLRVSVQNGFISGQPVQEYWYHFDQQIWTGPHSFPSALISALQTEANAFILAASGINGALWQSFVVPNNASTYVENGNALTWVWQTVLLPDNEQAAANQIVESTVAWAVADGQQITLTAVDDLANTLATVYFTASGPAPPPPSAGATDILTESGATITDESGATIIIDSAPVPSPGSGSIWGAFVWGASNWGYGVTPFHQEQIPWPNPLVFKQASMRITGNSTGGFVLGNLYARNQITGYFGKGGGGTM